VANNTCEKNGKFIESLLCNYEGKELVCKMVEWINIYSPVVTLCSNNSNIQQFYVHPHRLFMCFESISEQTLIISLYNINVLASRYVDHTDKAFVCTPSDTNVYYYYYYYYYSNKQLLTLPLRRYYDRYFKVAKLAWPR